jgi:putative SOS response-associated peptidase YedK
MCGRFVLAADSQQLTLQFALEKPPALTARYNIAPSQLVAMVAPKADPTKRGLAWLKWGFVPDWTQDASRPMINARAETVGGLSSFSHAFREQRCIIPASGFYEWLKAGKQKVPHYFRLAA